MCNVCDCCVYAGCGGLRQECCGTGVVLVCGVECRVGKVVWLL